MQRTVLSTRIRLDRRFYYLVPFPKSTFPPTVIFFTSSRLLYAGIDGSSLFFLLLLTLFCSPPLPFVICPRSVRTFSARFFHSSIKNSFLVNSIKRQPYHDKMTTSNWRSKYVFVFFDFLENVHELAVQITCARILSNTIIIIILRIITHA